MVGDRLAELAVAQAYRLVEVVAEFGQGGVFVAAGVWHAEHREGGDEVRVEVFVVPARTVEVGEQTTGIGPSRFDGGDHADQPSRGSEGTRRASAIRVSRWWSSSRRWRMSGGLRSLLSARAI